MTPRRPAQVPALPRTGDLDQRGGDADDLDVFLAEELTLPEFRGAYEDAAVREDLLRQLVETRRATHLTQSAVAASMGTTQSAVSELEGGLADPRLSTLQRYARAIGCRVAAWAVAGTATSDDVFTAFIGNEGNYIRHPSRHLPSPIVSIFNGQTVTLQIVGVTTAQAPNSCLYFAGRVEPSDDFFGLSTLSIEGSTGTREDNDNKELSILDQRSAV